MFNIKPPVPAQSLASVAVPTQKVFQTVEDAVSISYNNWAMKSFSFVLNEDHFNGSALFNLFGADKDGNAIASPFPLIPMRLKDILNDPDLGTPAQAFIQALLAKAQSDGVIS